MFQSVTRLLLLITIPLLFVFPSRLVSAQTVFANEPTGTIHTMDMRKCELNYLCTSLMFGDIAWQGGNLYGIQGLSLYTIDISNGAATLVATAAQGMSIPGMVGDGSGNLYMGDYSENLQKFNIFTGTFSTVGNVGITCSGDLIKLGDTIYMIGAGATLVKITLNPFSSTIIGTMNFGIANPQAYGMVPSAWHDTLVVSVGYPTTNKLFKVNTSNASVTVFCDSLTAISSAIFGMATDAEDAGCRITSTEPRADWMFFPNPAQDHLILKAPDNLPQKSTLHIFNYQGDVLSSQEIEFTSTYMIDLSFLSSGIYSLSLVHSKGLKNFKFSVFR